VAMTNGREKIRILALDDEPKSLQIIKKICNDYDVRTETNSRKAIDIINKEKFDIFIIDYQMPRLDGIEVLEEIKEVYEKEPYIGILCTAYGTMHLFKEEYCDKLFSYFIEKPFDIAYFQNTLDKAIFKLQTLREEYTDNQSDCQYFQL
jgi:DNA-binding NtrC family response regulator